jgi:isocitrate/isopropylmalate dehydrogenase
MLRHIGDEECARRVEKALFSALEEGGARTRDVGGTATTLQFARAVAAKL